MPIMKWIDYKEWHKNIRNYSLKEGAICRTEDGDFVVVGEINTSCGTNDEFIEEITHFTEDYCDKIQKIIKKAQKDFNKKRKKHGKE